MEVKSKHGNIEQDSAIKLTSSNGPVGNENSGLHESSSHEDYLNSDALENQSNYKMETIRCALNGPSNTTSDRGVFLQSKSGATVDTRMDNDVHGIRTFNKKENQHFFKPDKNERTPTIGNYELY